MSNASKAWPGHLALVVGNGGLTTQPGSAAAAEDLDLNVVFIEDAPAKNKALREGKIDAVWETVDELPIALGGYRAAHPVTVNFRSGNSDLTNESMALLNQQVVPQVQMAGGMYVRVEGNLGLSERRAHAIVDYLTSRGVDGRRMLARGNGSSKPLGSNKTAEGRARNRRTDVVFIPAGA
ncbi:MAG: OmpA family protein [Pseudomonadota bacterium]